MAWHCALLSLCSAHSGMSLGMCLGGCITGATSAGGGCGRGEASIDSLPEMFRYFCSCISAMSFFLIYFITDFTDSHNRAGDSSDELSSWFT